MEELNLDYSTTKGNKTTNIIVFCLFAVYFIYVCIEKALVKDFGVFFFIPLILLLVAAFFILKNSIWLPAPILSINNSFVSSNMPGQKKQNIDWATVSNANIGPGYIVLFTNGGQKQQKIDLLQLKYQDLLNVKSKIIELCEHKNIPYRND